MSHRSALVIILLLAFGLRVAGLNAVPPGWRDDEVIETTLHAQLVLDGGRPLYFIQAEGHEPLYHYVSAAWIALVGHSLVAVRLVSVFFGLLAVAATYRLTRQLFGRRAALLVALMVAGSFWALMYSRTKIRHISELPFLLLAFSHALRLMRQRWAAPGSARFPASLWLTALFAALSLYTYLAATTSLVILGVFALYGVLARYLSARESARPLGARQVPYAVGGVAYLAAALILAFALYLPLGLSVRENATRLTVVGGPLTALQSGEWQPLFSNFVGTLAMFGGRGDPEALYNIPGRPVFNLVAFYFFLAGLILAVTRWRDPRFAFLIIWLSVGLAPGVFSSPPASLGHNITVLPAVYMLASLAACELMQRVGRMQLPAAVRLVPPALLFAAVAVGDLPDYFWRWPADEQVRYLYKAALHAQARELRDAPPATYVLSGPLSKWDRVAFGLEGLAFASPPRWVNAEWAHIVPAQSAIYLFNPPAWLSSTGAYRPFSATFSNGLLLEGWSQQGTELLTYWQVGPTYAVAEPDMGPSVASPPFPAFIFLHLLNSSGFAAGSDRFDADAFSLQPGDRFIQRHVLDAPAGEYRVEIGLYHPVTGARYLSDSGADTIQLGNATLP